MGATCSKPEYTNDQQGGVKMDPVQQTTATSEPMKHSDQEDENISEHITEPVKTPEQEVPVLPSIPVTASEENKQHQDEIKADKELENPPVFVKVEETEVKKNEVTPKKQIDDKYTKYDELEQALRQAGIESIQLIVGVDFTASNTWQGEKTVQKPLHDLGAQNPYLQILSIIEPIIQRFDDDQIYDVYRFGCVDSKDHSAVPLCSPDNTNPKFNGFSAVREGYTQIAPKVKMSGPTTFVPLIKKAIELQKSYEGKQLVFLLILTDGVVTSKELDHAAIVEASEYPISICALGVGDGPFDEMVEFDDSIKDSKFDNFQFVDFQKFMQENAKVENPDAELATKIFNELPEQYTEMKKMNLV